MRPWTTIQSSRGSLLWLSLTNKKYEFRINGTHRKKNLIGLCDVVLNFYLFFFYFHICVCTPIFCLSISCITAYKNVEDLLLLSAALTETYPPHFRLFRLKQNVATGKLDFVHPLHTVKDSKTFNMVAYCSTMNNIKLIRQVRLRELLSDVNRATAIVASAATGKLDFVHPLHTVKDSKTFNMVKYCSTMDGIKLMRQVGSIVCVLLLCKPAAGFKLGLKPILTPPPPQYGALFHTK